MSIETCHLNLEPLLPGTVVESDRGLYRHVGLVTERHVKGERSVLSFSADAGGLLEEPLSAFARGGQIAVKGFPGELSPSAVMARARSAINTKYSWLSFNCEHFVRFAHGLKLKSPQIDSLFGVAALAAVFLLLVRR